MNKKIVLAAVVLLLLAGTGVYALNSKNLSSSDTSNQTTTQTMSEASEFAKAMESGNPTTCALTKDTNTVEYHLKGKMMRANITTPILDAKTGTPTNSVSHMINDTKYIYTWSDGQNQAVKFPIPTQEDLKQYPTGSTPPVPKLEGEADYQNFKDQGYTINCKASTLSDDIFTPPTDITFMDTSSMMKDLQAPQSLDNIDMEKIRELQQQYSR